MVLFPMLGRPTIPQFNGMVYASFSGETWAMPGNLLRAPAFRARAPWQVRGAGTPCSAKQIRPASIIAERAVLGELPEMDQVQCMKCKAGPLSPLLPQSQRHL